MQITIKDRETINGAITVRSRAMDVSEAPMLTATLVTHEVSGTSPQLDVQFETSDNLEDWALVGSPIQHSSATMSVTAFQASSAPWGRYVRVSIQLSGTDPLAVYSLWINTFPSS